MLHIQVLTLRENDYFTFKKSCILFYKKKKENLQDEILKKKFKNFLDESCNVTKTSQRYLFKLCYEKNFVG